MEDLNLKEFLEREEIEFNKNDDVKICFQGKRILITGAGGTIGSELVRQLCKLKPKKLILFDIYENGVYDLQQELKLKNIDVETVIEIGSVRDKNKIEQVLREHYPTIVFHAAAHKHVPLMENNPEEAIKNNMIGTYNLANTCGLNGVESFTLISTDKAVNPTSVMGASKRYCEMIIQYLDLLHQTKYSAVRFGNVLGSNGSVIPLFKNQILNGGPVTVTDKNIVRYFMLTSEAVQLVLQSSVFAKGGEIFILDMGKEVKIYDLAKKMIKKLSPNKDIKIVEIGLRPGEKMYEELLLDKTNLIKTQNDRILIEKPKTFGFSIINNMRRLEFDLDVLSKTFIKQNLFETIKKFEEE